MTKFDTREMREKMNALNATRRPVSRAVCSRSGIGTAAALVAALLFLSSARANNYYVSASTGSNSTGNGTQSSPWKTITYALGQVSGKGHTINVAAGTYNSALGETFPIFMTDGVSLVGAGIDKSIIDAGSTQTAVKCIGIIDSTTRLDGFTVTNGTYPGESGIYISAGSALQVSNNKITASGGNTAYNLCQGGIYVVNSSPLIIFNTVSGNSGSGIYVSNCSPTIKNNIITGNSGNSYRGGGLTIDGSSSRPTISFNIIVNNTLEGIRCNNSSTPQIINNTISGNSTAGIQLGGFAEGGASPDIVNNILAFNTGYGIDENVASVPGRVTYNLFNANGSGLYRDGGATNYFTSATLNSGVAECKNNLDGDPLFADRANGDFHLRASSPAINAGDPTSPLDPDGSRVDIGAYMYQLLPPPVPALSSPSNGATSQATTLVLSWGSSTNATQYHLQVSASSAFGSYVVNDSSLTSTTRSVGSLTKGITYYWRVRAGNSAGWSSYSGSWSFTTASNLPIVSTGAASNVGSATATLNGSVNPNGLASTAWFEWGTSSTLSTYAITPSQSTGSGTVAVSVSASLTGLSLNTTYYFRVTGQNSDGSQRGSIAGFTTAANTPITICVSASGNDANSGTATSPLRNIRTALSRAASGDTLKVSGGVYAENLTTPVKVVLRGGYDLTYAEASRNLVKNRTTLKPASGIMISDGMSSIFDGLVFDGSAGAGNGLLVTGGNATVTHNIVQNITASRGSCIEVAFAASATVKNNTVVNNILSGGGVIVYSIYIKGNAGGATIVQNNIAYNNDVGISINLGLSGVTSGYNCAFLNRSGNFDGAGMTTTDISEDPKLVNSANGDVRLKATSHCINAGNPADPFADEPAPNGGRIDMGAYGGTGSATRNGNPATYVSPSGSDLNDGSVSAPMRTIMGGLNGALGDTVKVAAGSYGEGLIMPSQAVLLGGYDGTFVESRRDIFANTTTLLGVSSTMVFDRFGSTIDGFNVNGNSVAGTAFDISSGSMVAHNIISGVSTGSGYGVRISGNSIVVNNVIRSCPYAISIQSGSSSAIVKNNIIEKNSFGITNSSANGIARYNDFFGNSFNYTGSYTAPGAGDLAVDPKYRNASAGDFRLAAGSVCIDGGDPTDPVGDEPSPNGNRIDLGAYGGTKNAGAPLALPVVVTGSPTNISGTSATINGTVNPNGLSTSAYFEWGTNSTLTSCSVTASQSIGSGTTALSVTADLTSLTLGTTYYYRVVGQNAGGIQRGSIASVTTSTSSALLGEYVADASTVLLLHMNETGGLTAADVGPKGYSAGFGAGTFVEGRFGNAFLPGDSPGMSVGDLSFAGMEQTFTIEGWVKMTGSPQTASMILADPVWLEVRPGLALHFGLKLPDGSATPGGDAPSGTVHLGEWFHLAGVLDNGATKLYMNGVLVGSGYIPSSIRTSIPGALFAWSSMTAPFPGLVDEIRLSNKARSPQEFDLQLPPKNLFAAAAGTSISLSWQNGGGAVPLMRYKIYRGTDSTNVVFLDSTATLQYSNPGISTGILYFYRVSAVDATGFEGAKSYAAGAIAGSPPATPTLALPADGTTGAPVTITLSWGAASGAASYRLQVSTSPTFVSTVVDDSTLTSTSRQVGSLSNSTVYYWRVSARNPVGGSSYSTSRSFTTIVAAPGVPQLTSPPDAAPGVPVNVTITWAAATRATTYRLQFSTSQVFATVLLEDSTLTTTSKTIGPLSNNTTYYWHVCASNAGGISAYSSTRSFTTIIQTPDIVSLTSPSDGATNLPISVLLSWSSSARAATYRLQMSTNSTFTSVVIDDSTLTYVSYQTPDLSNGTTYYWRLNAKNAGGTSSWSPVRSFTTLIARPSAPSISSPVSGATSQSTNPTLSWTSSSTATRYRLQVAANSSFFPPLLVDDTTVISTSYPVSQLSYNTTYYWRVSASNNGGSSLYSSTASFTTIPAPAANVSINTTVSFPAKSRAGDFLGSDYRIVGLPGSTSIPIPSVLSGSQGKDWQAFYDNGSASNYFVQFDGSSRFEFGSGKAFWIVSKSSLTINRSVSSPSLSSSGNFEIALQPGWNLIANPFASSIPWARIQSYNNTTASIFTFNGSFASSTNFDPYVGYYYFNGSPGTVLSVLKIPYYSLFGNIVGPMGQTFEGWKVTMKLSSEKPQMETEGEVWFGVSVGAKQGMDEFDVRMPRGIGSINELFFDRPAWDADFPTFASDVRARVTGAEKWDFKVNVEPLKPARLVFGGIGAIPSSDEIYLVDHANGRSANLRLDSAYEFVSPLGELQFSVLVGSKDAVLNQAALALPAEYDLSQNFPNPFNPTTSLRLSLPARSGVHLAIFNVLGQEIRTLHSGELAPGIHWFTWDGKTERLAAAPSGIYYCRMQVEGRQGVVRKLVLVK